MGGRKAKFCLEMEGSDLAKLRQFRFCKLMVKTDMSPTGFYGGFSEESAICGHVGEEGLGRNFGGNEKDVDFAILGQEWGSKTILTRTLTTIWKS